MNNDLINRSIHSVKWNAISNVVDIIFRFSQSIVLARLLPVSTFGVIAGASSIVVLVGGISNFGMGSAFTYRSEETQDINHTAAVHFTLQLIINLIWTVLMLLVGLFFLRNRTDEFLTAYIFLTLSKTAMNFMTTPRMILLRLIQHRRLAMIKILNVVTTFVVASTLALLNKPLWSLLSTHFVTILVNLILFYIWRPVWKPQLRWSVSTVKYFLIFGSKQFFARFLLDAMDRLDELWANFYLGELSLGFYSRAYNFAGYPSSVVATPISNVAIGTFAELAEDRKSLSTAFQKTNSFLIRSGFFLGGLLILIAPEFITILLTEKWMPMLLTFRVMLPYTLLGPLEKTLMNLFVAVGKPGMIVRIRLIQVAVLIAGLFSLGNLFGIDGVALAVDLMMVVGIIIILINVKDYVDFSIKDLFLIPLIAVFFGLALGFGFDFLFSTSVSMIVSGIFKVSIFSIIYFGFLFFFDRKELNNFFGLAKKYLLKGIID